MPRAWKRGREIPMMLCSRSCVHRSHVPLWFSTWSNTSFSPKENTGTRWALKIVLITISFNRLSQTSSNPCVLHLFLTRNWSHNRLCAFPGISMWAAWMSLCFKRPRSSLKKPKMNRLTFAHFLRALCSYPCSMAILMKPFFLASITL